VNGWRAPISAFKDSFLVAVGNEHIFTRVSGEILCLLNNRNGRAVALFPDMSPRFQRVEELYRQALERVQEERLAFLKTACAEDDELCQKVESLLASHEQPRTSLRHQFR
jgi:hypothetical protein